jgi:aminopeptidase N
MKKIFTIILLLGISPAVLAQKQKLMADNDRSDTMDILKYTINLNITDFVNKKIKGNTEVQFTPKVNNVNTISFDLLKLSIDSVKFNSSLLSYSYNDTLLIVNLPGAQNIGDTNSVVVFYQGTPKTDAQWGGFYFQGNYAYNMGVGFAADPHSFGRVWFPCFDNFVERSVYEFNITTNSGKVSYCNGILDHDSTDGSGNRIRKWIMNQSIPTYLACVAVAPFTQVNDTFPGLNGNIPIVLAAIPTDTVNVKNSFSNLKNALTTFEDRYGPYLWDKVGYSFIPFAAGAMEHATNIAYPRTFADGSKTYETVWAHELSHHWFGDLATCETAGDMWLNEGLAVFSEFIFTESVYGNAAAQAYIRPLHEDVLHLTHIKDGGYRAVSGIPTEYTYGEHVYNKGAEVARTLRAYMGDTAFFNGLKYYLNDKKFDHATSFEFRDALTASSGIDLTDFFNDWVFNPGFPHFSVDSFTVVPNGGQFDVTVHVKQKITGAPALFSNVPLEVTFMDSAWTMTTDTFIMNGATGTFNFTVPSRPANVMLDFNEKIAQAIALQYKTIKASGTSNFTNAKMNVTIQSVTDSAFMLVEHNYTAPDSFKIMPSVKYRLSPNHYWKVSGLFPSGFDATGRLYYDGRTPAAMSSGYLDNELIISTEDSLFLFYRKSAADDWDIYPYATKVPGTLTDKYGYFAIDSLLPGEFTFGMKDYLLSSFENKMIEEKISLYPNPTSGILYIESGKENPIERILIYGIDGRKVAEETFNGKNESISINLGELSNGIYFIDCISKGKSIKAKVIKQ